MRALESGERVNFMAFSLLGDNYETEGVVEGEATAWIKANQNQPEIDPEEYSGLEEGNAYIIKRRDVYGNTQRHLVYVGDMISVLPAERSD